MPGALTRGKRITDLKEHFESKLTTGREGDHWSLDSKLNNRGYCVISVGDGQREYAHRVAYRLYVGEIPEGLEIDHLCRVTWCVNPAHLEPVTRRENLLRAHRFCKNGHDQTRPGARYVRPKTGNGMCRVCQADRRKKTYRESGR